MSLLDRIKSLADQKFKQVVDIRRDLHAHPELSFEELETSRRVCDVLDGLGIHYKDQVAKTGIVATIEGKNPGSRTIALRADMDALPIIETNEVDYASTNHGVMHACGHDAHTASLLGTAMILNELRSEFDGTIRFLYQPAEEKVPSGAAAMIEEGVLENPKPAMIFGQHVTPELEVGTIGFRPGKFMASADEVNVTIIGKGGHAAAPHKVVDPVLIASHVVVGLQQLVSRNTNPQTPSVLSFGYVNAPGFVNIIPDRVELRGTLRTFDEEWRAELKNRIVIMAQGIARSMGGDCEVHFPPGLPYVFNDVDITKNCMSLTSDYIGEQNVIEMDLRMGAEDFAHYTHHVPGCFYRLGTGNKDKGITSNLHTSTFNIDEDSLNLSIGLMAWLAVNQLK